MVHKPDIIKITESPRESFQATQRIVSAQEKADYINILLKAGFYNIDVGSFVSPTAVPNLKDTAEVLEKIDISDSRTGIMVTVGNYTGAEKAMNFEKINSLGFLYSVSPTFLKRNTNASMSEGLETLKRINELCQRNNKSTIVNLCLAFGNPYGDIFNPELVISAIDEIKTCNVKKVVLADTLACGDAEMIRKVTEMCISAFPEIEFGLHLHSSEPTWKEKTAAAFDAGCRNFDSVILGLGGCPMSGLDMIKNLSTENLLSFCQENSIENNIDRSILNKAAIRAKEIF